MFDGSGNVRDLVAVRPKSRQWPSPVVSSHSSYIPIWLFFIADDYCHRLKLAHVHALTDSSRLDLNLRGRLSRKNIMDGLTMIKNGNWSVETIWNTRLSFNSQAFVDRCRDVGRTIAASDWICRLLV